MTSHQNPSPEPSRARFDGPFWVALLAGLALVGSVSLIALAAAAQQAAHGNAQLVVAIDS